MTLGPRLLGLHLRGREIADDAGLGQTIATGILVRTHGTAAGEG